MAKALLAILVIGLALSKPSWATTPSPALVATPPQPQWSELTVQQKIILAPLCVDWDSLEYFRQKKWLGIAERFYKMAPQKQRRIQMQMQEWGKLTPEQREIARQNFKAANRLPPEKKEILKQKWEEYSSLPEAEKEKFKQQANRVSPPKPSHPALVTPPYPRSALTMPTQDPQPPSPTTTPATDEKPPS